MIEKITKISNLEYVAYCHNHNWEGMHRTDYSDAQLDLEGHIGWFPNESHSSSGVTEVNKEASIIGFKVSVINQDENSVTLNLCIGSELIVPKNLISKFELFGNVQSGEKSSNIYNIVIDTSTMEGALVYSLAKLIHKNVANKIHTQSKSSFESNDTHTLTVFGTACTMSFTDYETTFNITGFSLRGAEGCSVFEVLKTGARRLRIKHDATQGTPCGNGYNAKVSIDIW